MTNPGDCTAVVMAAGTGSRMTDLSNHCPKPFLPIGPYPLIWYPIKLLEKSEFSDIIVIVRQGWIKQYQSVLSELSSSLKTVNLDVIDVPEDYGTADSLRHVADKVKTTALVLTSDLISDCDLSELMSAHRKYESSVTLLLSQLPTKLTADTPIPGYKTKQKLANAEKISLGFDFKDMDRVVFWKAQIDMEEEYMPFSKRFLKRFPCTRIQSTWTDCHAYIVEKFVIRYLQDKTDLSSFGGEVLPILIKKQISTYVQEKPHEDTDMPSPGGELREDKKKDLLDYAAESQSELYTTIQSLSLSSLNFGSSRNAPQKDLIRCYSFKQSEGFCLRANTVASYFEACKQIPRLLTQFLSTSKKKIVLPNVAESVKIKPKSQVGADSLVGENGVVGEKVSIKKSVIGKNCVIGDKVKITNSVVMDGVEILESSVITNCIIGKSAKVANSCELSSCIVGQDEKIETMSKHTNEVLSVVSQMMEVTLD